MPSEKGYKIFKKDESGIPERRENILAIKRLEGRTGSRAIVPPDFYNNIDIDNNKRTKERVEDLTERETVGCPWGVENSYLLQKGNNTNYEREFMCCIPEGVNIKQYIQDFLKSVKGKAVGMDFGGVGSNVFKEFDEGFFERSLGVCLVDRREKKNISRYGDFYDGQIMDDAKRGHTVLEADINNFSIYRRITKELDGRKINLIFERLLMGHMYINTDFRSYSKHLRELYSCLDVPGVMFIELPPIFLYYDSHGFSGPYTQKQSMFAKLALKHWYHMIMMEYKSKIEIFLDIENGKLRLNKLENAPEDLPMLDIAATL